VWITARSILAAVSLVSVSQLLITGHHLSVWFKLMVTVMEMTINGNKSNLLTVTVTEIPVK